MRKLITQLCRTPLVIMIVFAFPLAFAIQSQTSGDGTANEDLIISQELLGTWDLRNVTLDEKKEFEPPAKGGRIKFYTRNHWTVTQADKSGLVTFHYGGTYTINGNESTEIIEYAADRTEDLIGGPGETVTDLIGKTFKFKISIRDDRCTLIGNGNPYTETWSRKKM